MLTGFNETPTCYEVGLRRILFLIEKGFTGLGFRVVDCAGFCMGCVGSHRGSVLLLL